jgi:hypothetical protein
MVTHGIPRSADSFCMNLFDSSMKAAPVAHVTLLDIGRLLHRESLIFPYEKSHFFCDKRAALHGDGFPDHC